MPTTIPATPDGWSAYLNWVQQVFFDSIPAGTYTSAIWEIEFHENPSATQYCKVSASGSGGIDFGAVGVSGGWTTFDATPAALSAINAVAGTMTPLSSYWNTNPFPPFGNVVVDQCRLVLTSGGSEGSQGPSGPTIIFANVQICQPGGSGGGSGGNHSGSAGSGSGGSHSGGSGSGASGSHGSGSGGSEACVPDWDFCGALVPSSLFYDFGSSTQQLIANKLSNDSDCDDVVTFTRLDASSHFTLELFTANPQTVAPTDGCTGSPVNVAITYDGLAQPGVYGVGIQGTDDNDLIHDLFIMLTVQECSGGGSSSGGSGSGSECPVCPPNAPVAPIQGGGWEVTFDIPCNRVDG